MIVDFNHIEPKHQAIHAQLENWARWLRATGRIGMHPMFKGFKSAQHWEQAEIRIPVDPLEAQATEKAVSKLPEPHRDAIRWCYVYPVHPKRACREFGVRPEALARLVRDARTMLVNRGTGQRMEERYALQGQ